MYHAKKFITSTSYPHDSSGYNIHVFDIGHHQDYSSAQPIKVIFNFRPAVPAATNLIGYALLLTNKLLSVSCGGPRQFDLV